MTNNTNNPQDDISNSVNTDEATSEKQPLFQRFSNTFMRRRTHMSQNAEVGLEECKEYFAEDSITNMRELFDKPDNKLTFEIGFGMGSSLIEMAKNAPDTNFVGIEVHEPGLGLTAYNARKNGLTNVKLINGDALKLLANLPDNHIDTVQLYFPDPWQKKRHYKRRFVSHERMPLVVQKLANGGHFHAATDWEHYAFWMLEVLDETKQLTNVSGTGNFFPRPDFRPVTKFEQRGIDKGHGVWDLMYQKGE